LVLAVAGLSTSRAADGVLRIGTTGDYAPYTWRDAPTGDAPTGDVYGVDIALANGLAANLGLRAEYLATTWGSLVADATTDRFDIALGGISITPERLRQVAFSTPYGRDFKQPVVRCGEQKQYDTLREINRAQVRMIVNPGGTNERFARAQFPAATLHVHVDNRSVFDEILAGRADVMVTDSVEARLQHRAHPELCAVRSVEKWAPADKAILLPPESPLRSSLNGALRERHLRQDYAREFAAWEGFDWSNADAPAAQLARLIDQRLLLVAEVARAKWNTHAAIEDLPRERALLESLRARAAALNLPTPLVEAFFSAQIAAAKLLQRELHQRWGRQHRGTFDGVADLTGVLRPQIDQVTGRMLQILVRWSASRDPMPDASTMRLVSAAAVHMARAPLVASTP
jgi:chorismate mutase-like protein